MSDNEKIVKYKVRIVELGADGEETGSQAENIIEIEENDAVFLHPKEGVILPGGFIKGL